MLYQVSGSVPGPVFDTQLAAAMLGYPAQIGYADLVASELGHSIDKGQTRTDWSRRPLTPAQLAYAADDVHHLLELHDSLGAKLEAAGRSDWLLEDAAAYGDKALYATRPEDAWRRIKGFARLEPAQQAAAKVLAAWREQRAIDSDKPRAWVLSDALLLTLAIDSPQTKEQLTAIESLPSGLIRRRGQELLDLLGSARGSDFETAAIQPQGRPTPEETRVINRMMKRVREEATEQGIAPEVLATRRDVDALARRSGKSRLLQGWRHEVIGRELATALDNN